MQKRAKVEAIALFRGCVYGIVKSKWAKPVGAKIGWRRRETEIVFRNPVIALRRDEIELPNGEEMSFAYLERPDAVIVVPITSGGEMILINQYRYSIDQWCLEVPAGGTHDKPNESLEEVARTELREEVGGSCDALVYVTNFFSASSLCDEKCHVYLAENVTLAQSEQEAGEAIEVKIMPVAEALALARSGEMKDAQCALAILLCEPLLRARGLLAETSTAASC
jgi:ADP-ribose pyrophosphatase